VASVNVLLNAISKGDHIRDFQHASRMFVDNNYELQPRYSHLFHVVFNLTPQAAALFDNQEKLEINMLVKSIDLPSFNFDVQTHNQYNRHVHTQHKLNYNPVTVTFHDDQKDIIRSLLHTYASFYYADSRYALGGRSYNTNDRYYNNAGDSFGLATGQQRFFKDIRVYSMLQKRFAEYVLINPIINAFGHDNHSYANGQFMQHTMQIQYETVKYATGFVNNVTPKGFGEVHYDKTPSPLGVFGAGFEDSIFFRGGLVEAINTVARDLQDGNILGAIAKGAIIFNNTKDANLGKVLEKDLTRVLGSVLRGNNPLSDVILPSIFGVDDIIRNNTGIGGNRIGGTGAPVDRNVDGGTSNLVSSNSGNVTSGLFSGVSSIIDDPLSFGSSIFNPTSTRSPGSPRFLSDGIASSNNPGITENKQEKLAFLTDRINQLTTQIANTPAGQDTSFATKERDDLVQRRNLEFNV